MKTFFKNCDYTDLENFGRKITFFSEILQPVHKLNIYIYMNMMKIQQHII